MPGGATYREAHLIMELLHDSDLVRSVDIVELNPFLDERGRTARVAVELIGSLFGLQITDRRTPSNAVLPDRGQAHCCSGPRQAGNMPSQIMLAYLRDRSRHDLSIRLGIPANTVKTHLRRALLELRATMFASIEARTQRGGLKSPYATIAASAPVRARTGSSR